MQVRVGRSMGIVIAVTFVATLALAQTEPATTAAAKTPRILPEHQTRYGAAVALVRAGKKEEGLAQLWKLSEELRAELGAPGVDYFCHRGNDAEMAHFVGVKTLGNAAPARIVVLGVLPCNVQFSQAYMLVELKRLPEALEVLERLLPMAPAPQKPS